MFLAFFYAERSLPLMMLLAQDRSEQIYQDLQNHYPYRNESKLVVCFYD